MILRTYQERAVGELRQAYASGKRAPCLVMPTGSGKTPTASAIVRMALAKGTSVLFLAGRIELLSQAVQKLHASGVTDVRVIQADNDSGNQSAPVIVASVPTLATTRWRSKLPEAGLVVIDECHHVKAASWSQIATRYASSWLLGLTATPQRSDGRSLGDIFDALVVGATVAELIALENLVPCKVFAPPRLLDAREIAMSPVEAFKKHADSRPTIVFAATKDHARSIADDFRARGLRAASVFGDSRDRDETLAMFAKGEIDVLVNVSVLIEGWDCPSAAVAIFARKFTHVGGYLQAIGRVLRPVEGKTHAAVVDLCGSALVHGTPDLDRTFSLDGKGISSTDRQPIRQCQACGGVFTDRPRCPHCAFALPPLNRQAPRATGEGVSELAPKTTPTSWPMRAKKRGICAGCGQVIEPGTWIVYSALYRTAKHAGCARSRSAA